MLVYTDKGLNTMSQIFHKLYRNQLCRGLYKEKARPILLNSWEACHFEVNEDNCLDLARQAGELGIELFVLDDGWFGKRDDDYSSLGDWVEYREKLNGRLQNIAEKVHAKGMKFGLWVEPEMISEDSELFRAHPDWAFQVPNRPRSKIGRAHV